MLNEELGQPKEISDVIDKFRQKKGPELINSVIDVLLSEEITNEYCDAIGTPEKALAFGSSNAYDDTAAQGAVLFILLHRLASLPEEQRNSNIINRILSDDHFLLFFADFYNLRSDIGLTGLAFHATGTTSFIFKALTRQHGQCALKVIQAPYVRLPSIRAATARYAKTYGLHTKHSPRIYESAETWIVMEFIEGLNLNDYLVRLRDETQFLSDRYVSAIASIFHMVAEALAYYETLSPPMIHGDLTPFNIMVVSKVLSQPDAIMLIDFGPNYVLKDRLGSRRIFVEAFSRTELYTAPEVLTGQRDASLSSDLYSLGMIGLDLLCSEPLRTDSVGVRLREIWQNSASVGIAQIIEDLIDENPDNRILVLKDHNADSIYAALDRVLQDHVSLYRELVVEGQRTMGLGAHAQRSFKPDVWQSLTNIAKIIKMHENPYNAVTRGQLICSQINAACQAIIVSAFLYYTASDAFVHFFGGMTDDPFLQVINFLPRRFAMGDFWGNLPGRAVAVTFGLIAARYYANIFSTLRVTGGAATLRIISNILLRINSFSYFIPIMIAIVYCPVWWPFCSFVGTLFPALNNLSCWWVASKAAERARTSFSIEMFHKSETERFLRICREWSLLMGGYSLGIGAIGALLASGIAQDQAIYATLICIINIFKMYRNNCGSEAPFMAGSLSRLLFSLKRWAAKRPTSESFVARQIDAQAPKGAIISTN